MGGMVGLYSRAGMAGGAMGDVVHGGRLRQARQRYPGAPEPFVDLSTGINPDAYPFTALAAEVFRRLPEPEAVLALEAAAAAAYGVVDAGMVVAAPGTQALIQLLPLVVPQRRVVVVGPTYGEHAAAWRAGGAEVVAAGALEGAAGVVCNPNNPDGRRHDPAWLAARAADMDLLVVDEAFADFELGASLAGWMPLAGLVVLRSFGKTYGLAGVRLGFALAEPGLAGRLRVALGPWAVSGPAVAIGTEALGDMAWRDRAGAAARAAAARLDGVLQRAGMQVVGGTALFRLVEAGDAGAMAERLGRQGILVRAFDYAPGWLRFGLPGREEEWARLEGGLAARG